MEKKRRPSSQELLEQIREERRKQRRRNVLLGALSAVAAVTILMGILLVSVARPTVVAGVSMETTLMDGDILLVNGLVKDFKQGDIVASDVVEETEGLIVKRVIGVAGDQINIDLTGTVYVNGVRLEEPYLGGQVSLPGDVSLPVTVPEGSVFLMGDNRAHSTDSRNSYIGMVKTENIIGKVWFCLLPMVRWGSI